MNQYDIEAVVAVDGRGQILLPKDVREVFDLKSGSKLAVVVMKTGGVPCCLSLMPVGSLENTVREVLGSAALGNQASGTSAGSHDGPGA